MIYDLDKDLDREKYKAKVNYLFTKRCKVELTQKREVRTIKQNRYLHSLFNELSLHTGISPESVKQDVFKRIACKEIFLDNSNRFPVYRSTAELDTGEMTIAIEAFRAWSMQELGVYLPSPEEHLLIAQMEEEQQRYGNREYIQA